MILEVYGQFSIETIHERQYGLLVLVFCSGLCTIQWRRKNVEILELYVEFVKSKNELFEVSCKLMYLATF